MNSSQGYNRTFRVASLSLLLVISAVAAKVFSNSLPFSGKRSDSIDLSIAESAKGHRPLLSIYQTSVQNLGQDVGTGFVTVSLLNARGDSVLNFPISRESASISVPALNLGGAEGARIQWELHESIFQVLDSLQRADGGYSIRARVTPLMNDAEANNNVRTVDYIGTSFLRPGNVSEFQRTFRNGTQEVRKVQLNIEPHTIPFQAEVRSNFANGQYFRLEPGDTIVLIVRVKLPQGPALGSVFNEVASIIDSSTGRVMQQHSFYAVYDTVAPEISNVRMVTTPERRVAIQFVAADVHSAVSPSLSSLTYSVDQGLTWQRALLTSYPETSGDARIFQSILGPAEPGTEVRLTLGASDDAGNVQHRPLNVSTLAAPRGADRLLTPEFRQSHPGPSVAFESIELSARAWDLLRQRMRGSTQETGLQSTASSILEQRRIKYTIEQLATFDSLGIALFDFQPIVGNSCRVPTDLKTSNELCVRVP